MKYVSVKTFKTAVSILVSIVMVFGVFAAVGNIGAESLTSNVYAAGSDGGSSPSPTPVSKKSLSVKAKSAITLSYSSLSKAKKDLKRSKILSVSNAGGTVTYKITKVTKGGKKIKASTNFKINKKTGTLTVKKGTAAGTYKVSVKVKTTGNSTCSAGTKTATVTIKVKKNLSVKAKGPITLDVNALASSKKTLSKSKILTINNAGGTITYKITKVSKDGKAFNNTKFTISKKGTLTVKKGTKAGAYNVKIKVKTTGSSKYKAGTKTVTLKIIVAEPAPATPEEPAATEGTDTTETPETTN